MNIIVVFCIFISAVSVVGAQKLPSAPASFRHQTSVSYDKTLLNHPLLFSDGLTARYRRSLKKRAQHDLGIITSVGWVTTKDVDDRVILGAGGEYSLRVFRRIDCSVGIQAQYILTVLDYDLYEYTSQGAWENRGSLLHKFSPGAHCSLAGNVIRQPEFCVGVFLEVRMTRFLESYDKNFFEGYVPTLAFGLKTKF